MAMAHAGAAVQLRHGRGGLQWRYPPVMNDNKAATDFAVGWSAANSAGIAWLIPDLSSRCRLSDDFTIHAPTRFPATILSSAMACGEGGYMVHNAACDFNDNLLPVTASYWVKLAESYSGPRTEFV